MLVNLNATEILDRFSQSLIKLTDEIKEESKKIDANDPDPERTTAFMVNRKLKIWFHNGGNLGY